MKRRVASAWLSVRLCDGCCKAGLASHLLQQPQPVIVINQAVIEDPEHLVHPKALIHCLTSLSRK